MDTRKIILLMMLLAVFAGIYFASDQMAIRKAQRQEVNLAADFDAGRAAAITIKSPGRADMVLKKKSGSWTITSGEKSYAADAAAIAGLLEQVGKMKSATKVSKNPENFDSFEVSESKAVTVKIQDDAADVLAWVLLGKNGPDIFSTYVRRHEGKSVYLVPGLLKNSADRELSGWRDKALFKLDPDKINLYSVSGDKSLQLRKTNTGTWQAICDGRVSDSAMAAVGPIIRTFAALTVADFSENSTAEARLEKPLRTITAVLADGSKRTLFLGGDKNTFQQYAKTGDQEQIYVVEKAQLASLSPSCEEIKTGGKPPEPDQAPGAGTK